jgi:hypothetical protein
MIKCPCCGFEFEAGAEPVQNNEPVVVTRYHQYEYKPADTTFMSGLRYRCRHCGKRSENPFSLEGCIGFGGIGGGF